MPRKGLYFCSVLFSIFLLESCGQQTPVPLSVAVTPQAAAVATSQTVRFTVAIGNDATGVTWSATAGTIDANGNYAAPSGPIQPGGFMPSMVLHLSRRIPPGKFSLILFDNGDDPVFQPELRAEYQEGLRVCTVRSRSWKIDETSKNCDADTSSHDTDLFVFWKKCRRAEEWQRRVLRERQWPRDGRRYLRSNTGQQRPNRLAHICFGFICL